MRFNPPRLLALLPMLLCLTAAQCDRPSTASSIARTERPKLQTLPSKLTQTERLTPLSAAPTGELVQIDRGILAELYQRLAEYAGAVWRLNNRVADVKLERRCTKAQLETGSMPADCPREGAVDQGSAAEPSIPQ